MSGTETTAGDVAATAVVEVAEVTQDTVEEVNRLAQYIQDSIPKLAGFGVRVLIALAVFFLGRIVIRWIQKLVRRSLERSGADKGVEQFVDSFLKVGMYSLLIFSIAAKFGLDTASVAALLASGGVAIGLALQGSLSNFAGGVLILLLKPFEVGDYITEDTNHNEGTVKEIQIFYTKLSTIDNKTIVIPNGILTNSSLTNATAKDERRLDLKVSISYQADLRKAKKLIEEILASDVCVMKDEEINVFVDDLAESAVVLGARAWVKNDEFWPTRWRLLETIKLTLDEHEIEIPYPQMTVHVKE
ncbi:MAG: mechanosensitive ion channel [Dorea sp.]|nr:mechanosensitive ion channel [Dorea sp.]